MSYCSKCGERVGEDDLFCARCGAKLRREAQSLETAEKVGQPPVPIGETELESITAGEFRLVSCNEYQNGAAFHFENIAPDSLTGAVSAFLVKEGYKLEEGRPENGIYGKGSKALRVVVGGVAQRFRFHVLISPERKGAQLEFYKAMSGVSGGLIGHSEMNRALASLVAKLKSLPETQTAIVTERKLPTKGDITTEHVTVQAGVGIAKEQAGVPAWAAEGRPTAKPKAAGILSIVAGVIEFIMGISFALLEGGLSGWFIIIGIIAVVGGVYAIKRKVWPLALAGAICSLVLFPLGIPAIILVVLARNEFK